MSVLEQILTECVQNYIGLHWFFINPIFHDQILSYWYLFIIELNSSMSQSRTQWISYELIPSASLLTSLHFNTCTFSSIFLLTSSPFNRKTSYSPTCVKRSLTRNGSMTASYRLTAMQIPQNRVLWKTIKIVPFCTTIDHFMHRNYLINTIGFICVVPLLVTVQYRLKAI